MANLLRQNNKPKIPKKVSRSLPSIRRFLNRNRSSTRRLQHRPFDRGLCGRRSTCVDQQFLEEEDSQNQIRRGVKKCRLYRKWVRKRSRREWIRKDGSIGTRSEVSGILESDEMRSVYENNPIKEGFKKNCKGDFPVFKRSGLIIHFFWGRFLGSRHYNGDCSLKVETRGFPPLQVSILVWSEVDVAKSVVVGGLIGCKKCSWEIRRGKGVGWRMLNRWRGFGIYRAPECARWCVGLVVKSPFIRSEVMGFTRIGEKRPIAMHF